MIRQFEPTRQEYEAIVSVYNQANPYTPGSAETWQHWDKYRDPQRQFTRFVWEQDQKIVGYGFSMRIDPAANKYRFAIYFLPGCESDQLIGQFYSSLMNHCLRHSPTALICQTRENEEQKITWLKNQGFLEIMRYPLSVLTVADFKAAPYSDLKATVEAQGIEIISLADLAKRDLDWQRKLYDLVILLNKDVPRPTAFVPPSFEKFTAQEFNDPGYLPQAWLVALDGTNLVGTANLYKSGESVEILETGLTGVRRDYRRSGIATVLKCKIVEAAQNLGSRLIFTANEENNPMFQLNLRLGFEPQPAEVDWEKVINSSVISQHPQKNVDEDILP